jgi:hypothetical protein
LHQLLDEQKDVSLLRLIKKEQADLKDLTKRIAETSGTGAHLLEEFARKDESVKLKEIDLPPGETATRDAIAGTKKKELLGNKGDAFELALLLSQAEALSYASHLADVACENETEPGRAKALSNISADMRRLYGEVFAMLLSRSQWPRATAK